MALGTGTTGATRLPRRTGHGAMSRALRLALAVGALALLGATVLGAEQARAAQASPEHMRSAEDGADEHVGEDRSHTGAADVGDVNLDDADEDEGGAGGFDEEELDDELGEEFDEEEPRDSEHEGDEGYEYEEEEEEEEQEEGGVDHESRPDWRRLLQDTGGAEYIALMESLMPTEELGHPEVKSFNCFPDDDVIQPLTDRNYKGVVAKCPLTVVFFANTEDNNPLWKATVEEMAQLNRLVRELAAADETVQNELRRLKATNVTLAVVDVFEERRLARSLGVLGSNTVLIYRRRSFVPYHGRRVAAVLVEFLQHLLHPAVIPVRTRADRQRFKAYPDTKVVGFFEDSDSAQALAFQIAARRLVGVVPFFAIYSQRMADTMPSLKLHDDSELRLIKPYEKMVRLSGDMSHLPQEVADNRIPVLARLRQVDIFYDMQVLARQGYIAWAFARPGTARGDELLFELPSLALHFHTTLRDREPPIRFLWVNPDEFPEIVPYWLVQYGIPFHERDADFGLVDLKSMPAGAIWYDIDRDAPSALNLREWLLHITADPKRVLFNYVDTQPEFDKYKETGEFDERLGLKKPHQH